MKLLANENIPRAVVERLREEGHLVLWARVDMAGAKDEEVLARARLESRLILTLDKDFGELAFRKGRDATCGVILLRISPASPIYLSHCASTALKSRRDWTGYFAVVEESRIRVRPLPITDSPL